MPRNCFRKTTRHNWDENTMIKAINAVKWACHIKPPPNNFQFHLWQLKVSQWENVHAVGGTKMLESIKKGFTAEQELKFIQNFKDEGTMYAFTVGNVLKFAFEIA